MRRHLEDDETEFVVNMWFDHWDAVKAFAGERYEPASVPPKARELLRRYDNHARHFELVAAEPT